MVQKGFRESLQGEIYAQVQVVSRDLLDHCQRFPLCATGIHLDCFLSRLSAYHLVEALLDAGFSDNAPGGQIGERRLVLLLLRDFADVSEEVAGEKAVQIVALRFRLNPHPTEIQAMTFNHGGFAQRQTALQENRDIRA